MTARQVLVDANVFVSFLIERNEMRGSRVAVLLRDMVALPGVDDCPWKKVFEYWPERLTAMADAATVAIAIANRYDAVATFDQKMIKRMQRAGVESYW